MTKVPGWQQFEQDIQDTLGLDATVCSGNKWNDPGDAVDNRHPYQSSFPLLVDAKYTERLSWSLRRGDMEQWLLRGVERGKRAIVAVRIWTRGLAFPQDYVVLSMDDFAEMLDKARSWDKELHLRQLAKLDNAKFDRKERGLFSTVDRTYLERDEYHHRGA